MKPQKQHRRYTISQALALGLLRRVPRERTGNLIEADPRGRWVAFGDYHKAVLFMCENWVRDRRTGKRGVTLPRSKLHDIYERKLEIDEQWNQGFLVCMFCLGVDDPHANPIKTQRWKEKLLSCQMLGWNQLEYHDILMNTLVPAVQEYMSDPDKTLHNGTFAMGRPIETEAAGKGALLSNDRALAFHLKGGLFGPRLTDGNCRGR